MSSGDVVRCSSFAKAYSAICRNELVTRTGAFGEQQIATDLGLSRKLILPT